MTRETLQQIHDAAVQLTGRDRLLVVAMMLVVAGDDPWAIGLATGLLGANHHHMMTSENRTEVQNHE